MKRYLVLAILLLGIALLVLACAGDKEEAEEQTPSEEAVETQMEAAGEQEPPEATEQMPGDTLIDTLEMKAEEETKEP
jgi:hypothetical protein